MPNLALLDLVLPYVLRGQNLGAQHAALAAVRVVSYDTAADPLGTVIRGHCQFNGFARINPNAGGFIIDAGVNEAAAAFDPANRAPVFDIRETAIAFELFVPRAGSAIIAAGATAIPAGGAFDAARNVLNVWDTLLPGPAPSDYPASGFTLDLLLDAPSVRPPFLHPATLSDRGLLVPDPTRSEVAITLPRLRFRLAHGNATGSLLSFDLVSAGVTSLDDPGDIGVAELVRMDPPYAFVGGARDRVFGIGFRSATLDLSADSTPPAIIAKTGAGEDWTGLYLPEVRVFVSPEGARDFAFEAGANELLIGFGAGDGVWGDFQATLVDQGSGALKVGVRFFDADGNVYGTEPVDATSVKARLPVKTRMVVDVSGGRTPYTRQAAVNGAPAATGTAFTIDLGADAAQDIVVDVWDAPGADQLHVTLTVHAERRTAAAALPAPGNPPAPTLVATLSAPDPAPRIVIASQSATEVVLATAPPDATIRWTVDGGAESPAQVSVAVPLAPGQSRTVQARRPGGAVPASLPFYFFFDEPGLPTQAANEAQALADAAGKTGELSTSRALGRYGRTREGVDEDPVAAYKKYFDLVPNLSAIKIRGEASYEGHNDLTHRQYNYLLARRRAIAVRERLRAAYGAKNFDYADTTPENPTTSQANVDAWVASSKWTSHGGSDDRSWWVTRVELPPGLSAPDETAHATLSRPAAPAPPPEIPLVDPPVPTPDTPKWFRYVRLKARVVRSQLIAAEIEGEIDVQTAAEEKLASTGKLNGEQAPTAHTLQNGAPVGTGNEADGITKIRVLCQADPATGYTTSLISVGADPADKDGLVYWGWMPGEPVPASKNYPLTLLGSYLSFWPLLVEAEKGGRGAVVDATLAGVAAGLPGTIALLPWFRVERVIVFGAEYVQRDRGDEIEANILFDLEVDWSANIADLVKIEKEHPLVVRYKAIGLRLGNRADDGTEQFVLRPIFDSSRGYTIDVANGGALKIAEPLGQILRVLGARVSRTNPLAFEIDIGLGVDLGVVSVDRASLRVFLDEPRAPELTALAAGVDIPGALVGTGYMQIGSKQVSGNTVSTIGGQLDLTLRPLNLRVAAAVEVAQIPPAAGGPATGVYVGLDVVLPFGLPLGSSGLGIFGFRGIFGMHYQRNPSIGAGTGVPALAWLEAAGSKPHLLVNPDTQAVLWEPHVDRWAFGLGMLIGTMEGGVIMNLDGTLLLELPGPRVLIMMNARIVSPPPSMDGLGMSGGILAVIEVTPEHFLIGILVQWDIEKLVKIVIPVEAVFPFSPDSSHWHIYLGARPDLGRPVEVDVLGIVKGTGYLMFKGDGLPAYPIHNATLPAIQGFGIGLGAAASFTWGDTDIGLYLRVGGGFDAVLGLDPFVLAGTIYVSGELRLFIVSVGADAQLTVVVNEQPPAPGQTSGDLALYVHGEACGHVDFVFFEVKGCVDITISGPSPSAPMPALVDKVSIKSRSPALLAGTGVDRGIDASIGDALAQPSRPAMSDPKLVAVPVDAIPVISMKIPPVAAAGLKVGGLDTPVDTAPGVPSGGYAERGGEQYRYELTAIALERIDPSTGAVAGPAVQGPDVPLVAPVVWWTLKDATDANAVAQLALLTWEPAPATKAIEKNEHLEETITERWGRVCDEAAPPADVLWTFRWEQPGPSADGWDLEGMAWPDPPHTRRSSPPETGLRVTERWRSGDNTLDVMRGIFPALVLGGTVPCYQKPSTVPRPTAAVPKLVVGGRGPVRPSVGAPTGRAVAAGDPVRAALVKHDEQLPVRITAALHAKVAADLAAAAETAGAATVVLAGRGRDEPLPLAEVTRRLQRGEPLGRAELADAFGPTAAARATLTGQAGTGSVASAVASAVATPPRQCAVRVLEAPMLDDGRAIVFGDPAKQQEVEQALKQYGVTHGPLDDVVVLHTGGFAALDVLLFVRREVLTNKRLVARALNATGAQTAAVLVTGADVTPPKPLPPHWTDPNGPWADDIAELLAWQKQTIWQAVYLQLPKSLAADRVEIGMLHVDPPAGGFGEAAITPWYYVAAIGATRASEVVRKDWDDTQIKKEKQTIISMLGPESSKNSLLFADSLYRVTATWTGTRKGDGKTRGSETQTFWFKTDRVDTSGANAQAPKFTPPLPDKPPVPVRLDPWMLVTLPADREQAVFGGEPTRLVFNTHDVDRVFAAYGKELRVRFQAASARHPVATLEAPHPFPIVKSKLVEVKGSILSPWEETAAEVVDPTCVPVDEERVRHTQIDIPIPLDAYTDYILDVELVDLGAPADATGPSVYRRHFTTGGYPTLADFAASLQAPRPTARSCPVGALEAVRAYFNGRKPEGAELDDQLRAQGIEPLPVPDRPRIVVFWTQAGNALPQPAGVLIDATEALWRSRPYPKKQPDDTGPVPAERWVLADTEWLFVEDKSAAGVVAPKGVLRAPGGQRALIVLAPNQRGKTVKIDLVDKTFPGLPFLNQTEHRATLVELPLDRAPWEEV